MYILVSVSDATAGLLSPEAHASRDDALAALEALLATPEGQGICEADVRLIDVDAAAPVLFLVPPAPAEPATEPEEEERIEIEVPEPDLEVAESPPPPPVAMEPEAPTDELASEEITADESEPTQEDVDDAPSLADALQLATAQLVAEGIVEPGSVTEIDEPDLVGEMVEPDSVGEMVEPEPAAAETASETPPTVVRVVEEPMGTVPETADSEEETRQSWPWELESDDEPADEATAEQATAEPVEETAVQDDTSSAAPDVSDEQVRAYAPGELNMHVYACDDCVYVATCPKKGEQTPATCGSFQWKST